MSDHSQHIISIEDVTHDRDRIDAVISDQLPDLSRSKIKQHILNGRLTDSSGEIITDPSYTVSAGDEYILTIPPALPDLPQAEKMELEVVYEDDDIVVINKPAGLVVHPGAGNKTGTLVHGLIHRYGRNGLSDLNGDHRPGIVHRLDKDTTGVMVIARNNLAHQHLSDQLKQRKIKRQYRAVIWGMPDPRAGIIRGDIARHPKKRTKMAVVNNGKHAVTHYQVIRSLGLAAAEVNCQLDTGRTHQIRVHFANFGHPVIGDPKYGRLSKARREMISDTADTFIRQLNRQALHAYQLTLIHPLSGDEMTFEADLPADMIRLKEVLIDR